MKKFNRRQFIGTTALTAGAISLPNFAFGAKPKVVVVGGGAGGATAAKYIAKDSKRAINVTLIEASKRYYTCFYSNLYLGGFRNYASIGHNYYGLAVNNGINVVHDWAKSVDTNKKQVVLASGGTASYDRLVLSPGIDFKYESVPGYSPAVQSRMPHAWKSGTQTQLLKQQVLNMKKGGVFVLVPPTNPFRCPPGPYERVSMIAHLLKKYNPKGKIIILDPKKKFSKQGLFMEGWQKHYPGMIDWVAPGVHGGIKSVDAEKMVITTDLDTFKADAACVIPAQKAGSIVSADAVNDVYWCPINPNNMASKADPNIYVLGDASTAKSMPKSGFSANSQAKVVANAIRGELTGSRVFPASYSNTCWSLVATNDGIKVGASYKAGDKKIDLTSKFISKLGESEQKRQDTYKESIDWYNGMTKDMFP